VGDLKHVTESQAHTRPGSPECHFITPLQVPPEAADLLRRMLVTDPAERADVATVMGHPWFRRGLDPRLAGLNDALLAGRGPRPAAVRSCATSDEVRSTSAERSVMRVAGPKACALGWRWVSLILWNVLPDAQGGLIWLRVRLWECAASGLTAWRRRRWSRLSLEQRGVTLPLMCRAGLGDDRDAVLPQAAPPGPAAAHAPPPHRVDADPVALVAARHPTPCRHRRRCGFT